MISHYFPFTNFIFPSYLLEISFFWVESESAIIEVCWGEIVVDGLNVFESFVNLLISKLGIWSLLNKKYDAIIIKEIDNAKPKDGSGS